MFTPRPHALRVAIVVAAISALLVACDSLTGPEPPDRSPFEVGTLMGIDLDTRPYNMVPVEKPNLWFLPPTYREECIVRVHFLEDPEIFLRVSSGRYLKVAHTDLEVGMHLELWIPPGTLVESVCPGVIAPSHIVASMPR